MDGFTCPFWWNHWKVSLKLDWADLEPVLRAALGRLGEMQRAGGAGALPAAAAEGPKLQQGGAAGAAEPETHNRSLLSPAAGGGGAGSGAAALALPAQEAGQQGQQGAGAAGGLDPAAAALLAQPGAAAANGVPLSGFSCLYDDGRPEHRLCVFTNLVAHEGKLYYITGGWFCASAVMSLSAFCWVAMVCY